MPLPRGGHPYRNKTYRAMGLNYAMRDKAKAAAHQKAGSCAVKAPLA